MKKVTIPKEKIETEIDWDKPQWVQSIERPDKIVLTTINHAQESFSGTCMPCLDCPNGKFSHNWAKSAFRLLTDDIPFIISNKED